MFQFISYELQREVRDYCEVEIVGGGSGVSVGVGVT